jgi:hypothetical protein
MSYRKNAASGKYPAYPVPMVKNQYNEYTSVDYTGLSKREHFAALALEGLLAMDKDEWFTADEADSRIADWVDGIATRAVQFADALIAQLAEPNNADEDRMDG